MSFTNVVKGRSSQQAGANTETQSGTVAKTYGDADGNVSAADIRLSGQPRLLERVPNSSGLRLFKGMPVTINWQQGSRHAPSILAASGATVGATLQGASGSTTTSTNGTGTTTGNLDLSGTGFLVAFPDESLLGAYTEQPGANVLMVDVDPVGDGSGSGPIGGTRTIHAVPLVLTELPDPTGLLDGTCVDLVDETDGEPNGMYRLLAGVWVRRDTPGGEGGVSTGDRTRWDGAATTATAAQTEVTNARTREAGSGFAANTFASLKAHFAALWAILGAISGDVQGSLDDLTVTGIWGKPITAAASDPADRQILIYDGPDGEWTLNSLDGIGTVTAVDASGGSTGLSFSGGPITGSGTLTLGDTLFVAHGGTGGTTAPDARANLGAAPLAWLIIDVATNTGGATYTDPEVALSH